MKGETATSGGFEFNNYGPGYAVVSQAPFRALKSRLTGYDVTSTPLSGAVATKTYVLLVNRTYVGRSMHSLEDTRATSGPLQACCNHDLVLLPAPTRNLLVSLSRSHQASSSRLAICVCICRSGGIGVNGSLIDAIDLTASGSGSAFVSGASGNVRLTLSGQGKVIIDGTGRCLQLSIQNTFP